MNSFKIREEGYGVASKIWILSKGINSKGEGILSEAVGDSIFHEVPHNFLKSLWPNSVCVKSV